MAYLEKEDFEKSMGPISEVLKRSADSVKKDDLEEFAILGTGTFGSCRAYGCALAAHAGAARRRRSLPGHCLCGHG